MRPARDATSSRPQRPWSHSGLLLAALLACQAAAADPRDTEADTIPPLPPEQSQAVAAIEGRTGRVERDKEHSGAPVIRVMLGDPRTSDGDLVPLMRLATVQSLVIAPCAVTDSGLENLEGMADLRALYLSGNRVTDNGLRRLKGLERLEVLDLARTRVVSAGLAHLEGLAALEELPWAGPRSPTADWPA